MFYKMPTLVKQVIAFVSKSESDCRRNAEALMVASGAKAMWEAAYFFSGKAPLGKGIMVYISATEPLCPNQVQMIEDAINKGTTIILGVNSSEILSHLPESVSDSMESMEMDKLPMNQRFSMDVLELLFCS